MQRSPSPTSRPRRRLRTAGRVAVGAAVLAAGLVGAGTAGAPAGAEYAEDASFPARRYNMSSDPSKSAEWNMMCGFSDQMFKAYDPDVSIPGSGWLTSDNLANGKTLIDSNGYVVVNDAVSQSTIQGLLNYKPNTTIWIARTTPLVLSAPLSISQSGTVLRGVQNGTYTTILKGDLTTKKKAILTSGSPINVEITNLKFQDFGNYTVAGSTIVVDANSNKGWKVRRNEFLRNEGIALKLSHNSTAQYNCFKQTGQQALRVDGAWDVQVLNNEFDQNGVAHQNLADEDAGAMKIWASGYVRLKYNWSHNNFGPGIWFDNDNSGVTIERNYVADNQEQGIFYETSYNAKINYNTVLRNNTRHRGLPSPGEMVSQAGIFISNSGGADLAGTPPAQAGSELSGGVNYFTITGNYLQDNHFGVTLYQDPDRYCGSKNETSKGWCTLTGGQLAYVTGSTVKDLDYSAATGASSWHPINASTMAETSGATSFCRQQNHGTPTVNWTTAMLMRHQCYWTVKNITIGTNTFHRTATGATTNALLRNARVANASCWGDTYPYWEGIAYWTPRCKAVSDDVSVNGWGVQLPFTSSYPNEDSPQLWWANRLWDPTTSTSADNIVWSSNTYTGGSWLTRHGLTGGSGTATTP